MKPPAVRTIPARRTPRPLMLMTSGLLLATLLACVPQARAQQPCQGKLPDAKAAEKGPDTEKFRLIAQQCNVLEEPGRLHRAAQLDLYDRGPASVTIRMSEPEADPYAAPLAPPAVQPQMLPAPRRTPSLDSHGRRVLVVAPALLSAARANGIDPLLMHAIAHVESRHNPGAISHAGARGVMQVMPATGKRFGAGGDAERSLLDAHTNTQAGAAYLRTLQQRYGGDLTRILAAYNAGEGAVAKYNGVPPYAETQAYVREVAAVYRRLQQEFGVSPGGEIVARLGGQ
ncbi:lytic transglycosylase domain-containing protein [Azohydromonas caseinilytica]|uniref:Lytic transglycosylase domain-containing protein n=1 Tax=Azohydromonas caseinilytica TaxID=2728836 RepID=A0A848FH87_9BURK|nr:lytic transglycosylase domain-containing protein [Azohydromonas caseinilytica]NML18506.1 lytic transglycosylase domain-containing protein [Azohydromonas caseinilytica]